VERFLKGIKVAVVIRSRSTTLRGWIVSGSSENGVEYGGSPEVRYIGGADGSSRIACCAMLEGF
jgi:hypothetical protein